MFLSILAGLLILGGIVLFILFIVELDIGEIVICLIALAFGIGGICILWNAPYRDIYKEPEYIEELYIDKTEILSNLNEDNITIDNISAIKDYNEKVNVNNNLFLKWKKQDRSEFELDYDYYYDLYLEQRGYRLENK